ncbi:J domain-containing protein [Stigmatella aurantiaca]|uniref:DnaJ domain protein n=1 Tax=Stigmatella aurantiaca (strain DW4/3-1) TaxID=378806 RepID=Q08UD2_STIAD|nr:J domain-containing protein [Stigmatella aurantiaca]ADO72849.1 DnaJ domain protein [Stigmatella aurantiaca DW4/3-1]EAU64092.1 DnaJ domain protein [Stigmatella aurantiaca DW4/3-1]
MPELVDLEPELQRDIIEFERKQEGQDYFTQLGLRPGASIDEVKRAFLELSKRYHPDRFGGKNLGSFRARIERIFRRVSEAHTVLTQPERRAAYLREHPQLSGTPPAPSVRPPSAPPTPSPAAPPSPQDEERRAERQSRLTRHPYLARTHRLTELLTRGKAALDRGDFEQATKDLNQALAVDSKNREASTLLGEVRRRNEAQRGKRDFEQGLEAEKQQNLPSALEFYRKACSLDPQHAEAAFRAARVSRALGADWNEQRVHAQRAVELAPDRIPQRLLLAQILLDGKAGNIAKRHLEEVLKLDPKNAEASALLRKARWPF